MQSTTINVTQGECFVFITHNFNILFLLHACEQYTVEQLRVKLHAISGLPSQSYTRVITCIFVCLRVRCVDTACNVRVIHALYARVMLQSL